MAKEDRTLKLVCSGRKWVEIVRKLADLRAFEDLRADYRQFLLTFGRKVNASGLKGRTLLSLIEIASGNAP